jgi:hypothetical protein
MFAPFRDALLAGTLALVIGAGVAGRESLTCAPDASDCPSLLDVCSTEESSGAACEYCDAPALSLECVPGEGGCRAGHLNLVIDNRSINCGRVVEGVCGDGYVCYGDATEEYCSRSSCL